MLEPTYMYCRGTGWIPTFDDRVTVTNRFGTWSVINRKPNVGEMYAVFFKHDGSKYVINDQLDIHKYAQYIVDSELEGWHQSLLSGARLEKDAYYCVLEFTPTY